MKDVSTQEFVVSQVSLPLDIVYTLFSHFTPSMVSALAATNHQFMWILEDQDFWEKTFKTQFPEYFKETKRQLEQKKTISWHAAYIKREYQEYKNLTLQGRYWTVLLKERDMDDVLDFDNETQQLFLALLKEPNRDDEIQQLPHESFSPHKSNSQPIIHLAHKYKRQRFLDYVYSVLHARKQQTIQGYTELHEAVLYGQPLKLFEALTVKNPSLFGNKENLYNHTPLSVAACVGNIEAAKWLIQEQPSNISHLDLYFKSPCETAILFGQLEFVKYLTTTNFYEAENSLFYAFLALEKGYADIALFLIDKEEKYTQAVKYRNKEFYTPSFFWTAVDNNAWDIVILLMEKASKKSVIQVIFSGKNPVSDTEINAEYFFAAMAKTDRMDILEFLRKKIPARKIIQSISLDIIQNILLGLNDKLNLEFLKYLASIIEEYPDVLDIDTSSEQYFRIVISLWEKNFELFKVLFEENPHGVTDYFFWSDDPAFSSLEIMNNRVDLVEYLLEYRARRNSNYIPLIATLNSRAYFVIEAMIKVKWDVNQARDAYSHPLIIALKNDETKAVKLLIQAGAQVNAIQDEAGNIVVPIQVAFDKENLEALICLLEAGAKIAEEQCKIFLSKAIKENNIQLVELLAKKLKNYKNIDEEYLKSLVFLAAESGCILVLTFLTNKYYIDDTNPVSWEETLIHHAYQHQSVSTIEYLFIDAKPRVEIISTWRHAYLSLAAEKGNLNLVNALLKEMKNQNLDQKNQYSDKTPLFLAVENNHIKIVEALAKHGGADIISSAAHEEKYTPLIAATKRGFIEVMKFIIRKRWADIEQTDITGDRLIFVAFKNNQFEAFKYLIKQGAEVTAEEYRYFFFKSAKRGNLNFVQHFIENIKEINVDSLNIKDKSKSALYSAVENDRFDMAKFLIEKNASVKNCDLEKMFLQIKDIETPYLKITESTNKLPAVKFKPTQNVLSHAQINNIMQLRLWHHYCFLKYNVLGKLKSDDEKEMPQMAALKDMIYRLDRDPDKPFSGHMAEWEKSKNFIYNEDKKTTTRTKFNFFKAPDPLDLHAFFDHLKENAENYAKNLLNREYVANYSQ